MDHNAIELVHVVKRFGAVIAVNDVSLQIKSGTFVTLLGPSGCGKTTTLRMIAGLEDPTDGEVLIAGKPVYSRAQGVYVPTGKRQLGMVFQSYALWPHMTVNHNIAFGLETKRVTPAETARRVEEALRQLRLAGLGERFPSELSGGQQQRVALARMLVMRPQVFLMDEPLSNLDAKLRLEMRAEIKRLHREAGATTVYVTHDQVEALTLSDIVVVMHDGIVQQVASPQVLYRRPANLFVADFIGSPAANFIRGQARVEQGRLSIHHADWHVPTDAPLALAGRELVALVRPEDITLSTTETPGSAPFTVYSVLPMGAELIVQAKRNDLLVTVRLAREIPLEIDAPIYLHARASEVNVYDAETQLLIHPR